MSKDGFQDFGYVALSENCAGKSATDDRWGNLIRIPEINSKVLWSSEN